MFHYLIQSNKHIRYESMEAEVLYYSHSGENFMHEIKIRCRECVMLTILWLIKFNGIWNKFIESGTLMHVKFVGIPGIYYWSCAKFQVKAEEDIYADYMKRSLKGHRHTAKWTHIPHPHAVHQ